MFETCSSNHPRGFLQQSDIGK